MLSLGVYYDLYVNNLSQGVENVGFSFVRDKGWGALTKPNLLHFQQN